LDRPNILLIHSDQHRYDCVGVNGHPLVRTPNMDRLAAEGVNFTHAFTPIPLCVPARNCLLHGVWTTTHRCIANYDTEAPRPADQGLPTFSAALREAGYWLGYVGKWHVSKDRGPLDYGFHEAVAEGAYWAWRRSMGLAPRPGENWYFGETDPHIRPEQSRMAWGADHALRMIEDRARRREAFFIRWDPSEPHLPCVPPEPYASMYPAGAIPPWPGFHDDLAGKPFIQAQQRRSWKVEGWTWEQWAPVVSRYLAEITLLDAQVGRLLDALDRLGLAGNTLVIYTTDHGDLCGDHGMMDKHFVMYDAVVRVPLIARWPAVIAPGRTCHAFVSHAIDLAATFCEAAAAAAPAAFEGQSLMPLFRGADDNGRPDIFCQYMGNQFGLWTQRMVRDRRWKYVWNATGEDELYDVANDPGEVRNLAGDAGMAGELARLRKRLVEWMDAICDPMTNTWMRRQLLEGLKTQASPRPA
jgi:arylsulfatase A-like enzyme